MKPTLVFLTGFSGPELERLKAPFLEMAEIRVVSTREQLDRTEFNCQTSLLSFGTGVLVSEDILQRLSRPAYNLHAASPEFPGRDPHHHAIYRGAKNYGATLHVMTKKTDAGPIVATEIFPVPTNTTPASLLAAANEAGLQLIERLGARLLGVEQLPALEGVHWGPIKTARTDLLKLCQLTPLIDEAEFERRYRAFDGGAYDNLTITLHNRRFRIDKKIETGQTAVAPGGDFTEIAFGNLVEQLKLGGYCFARYGERPSGRHVLWRHDVDVSMHRAVRLAAIEAEIGAFATYFISPRCVFYNLFEPEIAALVSEIAGFGHEIGLHFDAGAYPVTDLTSETLRPALARERAILELLLGAPIRTVSWHNPDLANLLDFDTEEVGGLVNADSARVRHDYIYCSDSNGYWRFKPMLQVIAEGHERLNLLTHPAWWTPEPMAPSDRIDRAILGRARRVRSSCDAPLQRGGRKNVTAEDGDAK